MTTEIVTSNWNTRTTCNDYTSFEPKS